jgi:quinol monooxygenase YgiN
MFQGEGDMAELLTVVAEINAKPGKEAELRATLLALIGPTRKEAGCVQYDLHVHTSDPGRFVFYENWTSQEALARHAASAHLKLLDEKLVDLAAGPPKVETYTRIA